MGNSLAPYHNYYFQVNNETDALLELVEKYTNSGWEWPLANHIKAKSVEEQKVNCKSISIGAKYRLKHHDVVYYATFCSSSPLAGSDKIRARVSKDDISLQNEWYTMDNSRDSISPCDHIKVYGKIINKGSGDLLYKFEVKFNDGVHDDHEDDRKSEFWALPYGGNGGGSFGPIEKLTNITAIRLSTGWYVDSIQFQINGTWQGRIGGTGGGAKTWTLDKDEYINKVNLKAGIYIDHIEFITNKGQRISGGGTGGGSFQDGGGNVALVGCRGKCGWYINQLEFKWITLYGVLLGPYMMDWARYITEGYFPLTYHDPATIEGVGELVRVADNKLYGRDLKTLTIAEVPLYDESEGHYSFIVTPKDRRIIYKWNSNLALNTRNYFGIRNYVRHGDLNAGKPVITAGEFYVRKKENGHICLDKLFIEVNNSSGHYKPGLFSSGYAMEGFRNLGCNTSECEVFGRKHDAENDKDVNIEEDEDE